MNRIWMDCFTGKISFFCYMLFWKYDSKCVELSKFIYSWLGAVSLGIGSLDLCFVFMDEILSIQFTGLLSMAAIITQTAKQFPFSDRRLINKTICQHGTKGQLCTCHKGSTNYGVPGFDCTGEKTEIFFITKWGSRSILTRIGHQNWDHNHLQETHLTKHNFLSSALKCDVFKSDHKEVKIHPKHLVTLHENCLTSLYSFFLLYASKTVFLGISCRAGFCAAHEGNLFEAHSK